MSVHDDLGGDYGYDCAHEVMGALKVPSTGRRSVCPAPGHNAGRELDPHGDFGYDQAHEV
ncbi:MAG: hypothetical protein L0H64_11870 [Pseudonocardia sp.]|nr:hypothetical protein [Pseudonocardia sp.]